MATLPQNRPCLILFISFIHESREFLCSLERKKPEVFKTHHRYFCLYATSGAHLTLFSSCPYLGMLYLIKTPPSRAGRFGDFLS